MVKYMKKNIDNFLERITLMTAEENILAGQKELNKLYLNDHIKDLPLQDRLAQVNLTRTGDRVDLYRVNRRLYPNGRTD